MNLFLLENGGFGQSGQRSLPSRFLFEIGEENYDRIGVIPKELLQQAQTYIAQHSFTPVALIEETTVGKRVVHKLFGEGTVSSVDNIRGVYSVKFDTLQTERQLERGFFEFADENPSQEIPFIPVQPEPIQPNPVELKPAELKSVEPKAVKPKQAPKKQIELTTDPAETNLWLRADVPHSGWQCTGVTDLGPNGRTICKMCNKVEIRYIHHMVHPEYPYTIGAGCECAGKMEGNPNKARERERDMKNRGTRRETFLTRKWKTSAKGNRYIKYKEKNIVVTISTLTGKWNYAIDKQFAQTNYETFESAALAAFDEIETKR